MGSIESRLRRLEEKRGHVGRCSECGLTPGGPGRVVVADEERPEGRFEGDPDERCAACGRLLWCVMRVVYEDAEVEEGGGALANG